VLRKTIAGNFMTQSSNKPEHRSDKLRQLRLRLDESSQTPATSDLPPLRVNTNEMKLIPWSDIWASLTVAQLRGNGEMIEVFYDTLFKEAVFDDRGAWSIDIPKRN